jgi:hypothetical protein
VSQLLTVYWLLFVFTQLHNGIKLYLELLPSYETATNPRSTILFRTGRYILNTNQQYKQTTCGYLFRLFSKSVAKENVQSSGNSDLNSRLIHGEKTKEACTFMLFSVDSYFISVVGVASYWMINLFTWPTVSTYKRYTHCHFSNKLVFKLPQLVHLHDRTDLIIYLLRCCLQCTHPKG